MLRQKFLKKGQEINYFSPSTDPIDIIVIIKQKKKIEMSHYFIFKSKKKGTTRNKKKQQQIIIHTNPFVIKSKLKRK